MPFLFLSPSTQAGNPYVTEGNERLWMNRSPTGWSRICAPPASTSPATTRKGRVGHVYPRLERRKL